MGTIGRIAAGAALAGLMAGSGAAQTPDKPTAPTKPTVAVKPTTGDKPAPPTDKPTTPTDKPTAPATGKPAPDKPAPTTDKTEPAGLKVGTYQCIGTDGTASLHIGFKVTSAGHYTDMVGNAPGAFTVTGNAITFNGGIMAGTPGRNLKANVFAIGTAGTCQLSKGK